LGKKIKKKKKKKKSVRSEAGNSFKSSLYYRYIKDTRNDQMLPSRGALFKFYQELAGLGGDVQFLKHEAETQWNIPLGKGFVSIRIKIKSKW